MLGAAFVEASCRARRQCSREPPPQREQPRLLDALLQPPADLIEQLIEIDLSVGQNGGQLLDAVGRTAPTELIGEVLRVEVGENERRALPTDSPGHGSTSGCVKHEARAASRAIVAPMIVWPTCARRIRVNESPFIARR